jgi:hypothetical protein
MLLQFNDHCMLRRGMSGVHQWVGIALQAWRSRVRFTMVSMQFFVDIFLPATLWPWDWLSFW